MMQEKSRLLVSRTGVVSITEPVYRLYDNGCVENKRIEEPASSVKLLTQIQASKLGPFSYEPRRSASVSEQHFRIVDQTGGAGGGVGGGGGGKILRGDENNYWQMKTPAGGTKTTRKNQTIRDFKNGKGDNHKPTLLSRPTISKAHPAQSANDHLVTIKGDCCTVEGQGAWSTEGAWSTDDHRETMKLTDINLSNLSFGTQASVSVIGGGTQSAAPHVCTAAGCTRTRINVSGQHFETRLWVLNQHPTTLLGNHRRRLKFYDSSRDELFFDRHRPSFEAIFAYYQNGGKLRRPYHVPDDVFMDELTFYELEAEVIEEHKRSEGYSPQDDPPSATNLMGKIWLLFEYPETSTAAFVIGVISVIMTLISIVLFCVETLPMFATSHCETDDTPNFLDPFFIIETTCTLWFTLETLIRFVTCPCKIQFCKDFKNLIDITAILPYYVTFFTVVSTMSCESAKSSASLAFLRVTRLIRIFKLTKHSIGLQVLLLTFRASIEGLGLFLVALCVSLLVFSSAIYYAELDIEHSQIHSIPDGFWWAIITMTTVGYGDKVPLGTMGKLVGAACAICGVLTLAIPVPIITGHFNRFYAHKTGRGRNI